MRKIGLILSLMVIATAVYARERSVPSAAPTFRNDGNSNAAYAVTCSSYAWTAVGSTSNIANTTTGASRRRRRAMTVQTLATVSYAVCLSSTSVAADTCADGRPGYELGSSWASVSIYDEAAWYCQTRTGGSTAIKAVEHFDNRDESK